MSKREDQLLDAFDNFELRGGSVERLDKTLEAVILNLEMVLDEQLQFTSSDFFSNVEVPRVNFLNS